MSLETVNVKCILCKICEARQAIFNEKFLAWLDAQTNSVAIMEREADPASIYQAHDLLKTNPAESFRQYLALAEQGSVWSMATVGQLFENGTGTARDLAHAERWLLCAYEAGSGVGGPSARQACVNPMRKTVKNVKSASLASGFSQALRKRIIWECPLLLLVPLAQRAPVPWQLCRRAGSGDWPPTNLPNTRQCADRR